MADLGSAGFEVLGDVLVILRDTKQQGFQKVIRRVFTGGA